MDFKDLKQRFTEWYEKIKSARGFYKQQGIRPTHDWKVIVISTFIFVCIAGLGSLYLYVQIDNGKLFTVAEATKENEVKLDETLLQKIVSDLNARQGALSQIKSNKSAPPDPSL